MDLDPSDLDASAVAEVITATRVCSDCISRSTGIPRWRIADALQRLATKVKVTSSTAACVRCHKRVLVHKA